VFLYLFDSIYWSLLEPTLCSVSQRHTEGWAAAFCGGGGGNSKGRAPPRKRKNGNISLEAALNASFSFRYDID
jgi:hypothetical protein